MLRITDLTLSRGTKKLFDSANLTLPVGHKTGLIGANGCGKSNLFAAIRGEIAPDAHPAGLRIGSRSILYCSGKSCTRECQGFWSLSGVAARHFEVGGEWRLHARAAEVFRGRI